MNTANQILAAMEAAVSGTEIDENGTPVTPAPVEAPTEEPTPAPALSEQDKWLMFLALMRDVLGHEGYDKFLVEHATELEVYNLIPSAEKVMVSHKHLHPGKEELTPSEKEAAVALARNAGDPDYESLVEAEHDAHAYAGKIFEQYKDAARAAVQQTLAEVTQKIGAVDFDGADTIRNVVGTAAKRYAPETSDDAPTAVEEAMEGLFNRKPRPEFTMDVLKQRIAEFDAKHPGKIDKSSEAKKAFSEQIIDFDRVMSDQPEKHELKVKTIDGTPVLVYTIDGKLIEGQVRIIGKKRNKSFQQ